MNLRDQLLQMAAAAIDDFHGVMPAGLEAEISVIISHKGTVNDAMIVGDHELSQALAIVVHLDRAGCEVLDATATTVKSLGVDTGRGLQ
ncbi:hypothetical protein [Sphingobium sp. YG1]|uniref:hypothetical protein n=1 Tax=Sphingobium sp. YG1 TaxID=2082188 RepID=UPI000E74448E|nr:hypothetical protein [Sphingobium sp. YG1]